MKLFGLMGTRRAGSGSAPGLRIVPLSVPVAQFGVAYEATWQVLGGTAPYTLTDSTLPTWADAPDLTGDTITVTGTPDAVDAVAYLLEVTDDVAAEATREGTITTVAVVPAAPTNAAATGGDTTAEVDGDAPASDGGDPVDLYRATSSPGGITATNATLPITVTGLTNGQEYTFTLAAQNSAGWSDESDPSNAVTPAAASSYTDIIAAGVPAGFVTFTRSSAGWSWNSSSVLVESAIDTPRVDYNPATGVRRGLLIEKASTNEFNSSQVYESNWSLSTVTADDNNSAAPNGATTACLIEAAGSGARVRSSGTATVTSGANAFSVFAKSGTTQDISISNGAFDHGPGPFNQFFDITDGTTGTAEAGWSAPTIRDCSGGWWRCAGVFTTTTDLIGNLDIRPRGAAEATPSSGDNLLIWQAQLEAGPIATSIIPTSGTVASRLADNCTVTDLTDIAHDASVGTFLFIGVAPPSVAAAATLFSVNDNTANEVIRIHMEAGGALKAQVIDGGSTVADLSLGSITALQSIKVAISYAANDIKGCLNGGTVQTDASATLPTVDRAMVGRGVAGDYLNGWIDNLRYYPSAEDTQALTT